MSEKLEVEFALLKQAFIDHKVAEEEKYDNITKELVEVKVAISDLVSAWKAAGQLATFIKWLAGIAAAVGVLATLFGEHIHIK